MNELTLEWLEAGRKHTQKIYEQQKSKNPGTVRIGRDIAQCDIVLSHPTVSGLHVEIFFQEKLHCFYIRNLRMSNSPIVDGQHLYDEEVQLLPNSNIYLGEMHLKVVDVSVGIAPTIAAQHGVLPNFEEQRQLHQRINQPDLSPTPENKVQVLTHPTNKFSFFKTGFAIIVSGVFIYGLVKLLGPLLPLALTIWFWRGNVFSFDPQKKNIVLKISGVFFALELVLSFLFGWGWVDAGGLT
jgi:FHA domain